MRSKCGEHWGHHRGLRPDHLFKGVARELGRAESFPAKSGFKWRDPTQTTPGGVLCSVAHRVCRSRQRHEQQSEAGYRVRSEKRTNTR